MKNLCNSPFVTLPLDDPKLADFSKSAENKSYAMVSVPWQTPGKLYSACEGLNQGTIFVDLDQPYVCSLSKHEKKEGCNCE